MYRFIEKELENWSLEKEPMPLLLRGARQVGKTYIVKTFAEKHFKNFVYLNLETDKEYFEDFKNFSPHKLINKIFTLKNIEVKTKTTLIFIDEIQECPEAITTLRYFYEEHPGLHVIGAGSLLDFALSSEKISVPVGRVQYLFMQPMNFLEFLIACGNKGLYEYIKNLDLKKDIDLSIHKRLLEELKTYFILGGMPGVIKRYIENNKTFPQAFKYQDSIIDTYKDDFKKYAKKSEQKYLKKTFQAVPSLVGKKTKYSAIDSEFKAIDLRNALDLLIEANVINKIKATSLHSKPLEVLSSEKDFKTLFIDVGLMQKILGLDLEIIYSGDFHSSAAGQIAEQFVGQELLAHADPYRTKALYYWFRDKNGSSAEVDFVINVNNQTIPLEVKSGAKGHLKSLKICMEEYKLQLGIKCSQEILNYDGEILSLPLYAISEISRLVLQTRS